MLHLQLHGDNAQHLAAFRLRWAEVTALTQTNRRDTNYEATNAHSSLGASERSFGYSTRVGMTETPAQQDPEPPSGSFEPECGASESISAGEWVGPRRSAAEYLG